MNIEEIEKLIAIFGSFGVGALIGGGLIFYFIKSYLPAYLSEKGKNLATKEDIQSITDKVESVKAGYAEVIEKIKSNNQIKIAAIEREKNTKKEVYMDAVDAITRSQNIITTFSNLNIPEEQITSSLSEDAGKIAKVQIVGSKETVNAVTTFMGEIGIACLNLMLERNVLMERKNSIHISGNLRDKYQNEVERYIAIMKNLNLSGNRDPGTWDYVNKSFKFESEQRDKHNEQINTLSKIQNKEHIDYVRKCMCAFFEISTFLPKAVFSVRSELDLEISKEDYLDIFNKNIEKSKSIFEEFLGKVEARI
ncbi:MAG: chromosome segregation ATPase [Desulfobacteraceae bacterium]|nr:chromosome segregation ATPase [Desulfobacteraceae bacterium]